MTSDAERAFLADIAAADPADESVKLIFADWLEERGDPRGQLIRAQCRRVRSPIKGTSPRGAAKELLRRHGAAWRDKPPKSLVVSFEGGLLRVTLDGRAAEHSTVQGWWQRQWPWVSHLRVNHAQDRVLEVLGGHGWLNHLTHLDVAAGEITNAAMPFVAALENLRELNLHWTRIDNAGLAHVAGLRRLRRLVISRTPITGAGLQHLRGLSELEALECYLCHRIEDRSLSHLSSLTRLRELNLDAVRVGDAGLARLAPLKGLEVLNVSLSNITGTGLRHLSGLTRLRRLLLSFSHISDTSLAHLAPLQQLELFVLSSTRVTDGAVPHLVCLRGLKKLDLRETEVTPEGVRRLREALPDLKVEIGPFEHEVRRYSAGVRR